MPIKDDLISEVNKIFKSKWEKRDGYVVPDTPDLKLANDAVAIDATVLYADMADSTLLVDKYKPHFAAEIYKTFLHCAGKIIRDQNGFITAYDGDRIMAVFIGDSKNADATRAGLKINGARIEIINPALIEQYKDNPYRQNHVVGIDTSSLWVARTGVRGANDLVWVGRAANHAAKIAALSSEFQTRITKEVFLTLPDNLKNSGGKSMWQVMTWTDKNRTIYRSNYYLSL